MTRRAAARTTAPVAPRAANPVSVDAATALRARVDGDPTLTVIELTQLATDIGVSPSALLRGAA